ncbi:sulfotransferase domain-containing protein [Candidatus Litorirhabdus singularis]|uniref:sulfotransferase domain-containing protein n=1 Tax=Candidatus Litorirhabdus singularis TaxID=2518993 RepID=UPI003B9699BE
MVVSTYAKSGTAWLQQMISQLLFNGDEGVEVAKMSPSSISHNYHNWLDKNGHPWWPFWEGGAKTFIHRGTNGRWPNVLSAEEASKYEPLAIKELSSERAQWLATGEIL